MLLPKDPDQRLHRRLRVPRHGARGAAAAEQQAYLATGPGPRPDAARDGHVIRQVGSTVVFYDWLPGGCPDPRRQAIQAALETLGVGYPVAS